MPTLTSPPFITPPSLIWPFAVPAPDTKLALAGFDAAHFDDDDFVRHGLKRPASLARAVAKRRAEYLAGRLCARTALEAIGLAPGPLERLPDRQVAWPTAACGAITHARNLAGALVAPRGDYRGVGLDAEPWLTPARAAYLAPSILVESEQTHFNALAPAPFARAVTLAFSLKESLFKALYPIIGVRFYFHDAHLDALDASATHGRCRLVLRRHLTLDWPAGRSLEGLYCDYAQQALTSVLIDRR